ncbi:uncharacterized protein LOC131604877 [Vicia villosa]|uniref:uncharacterized protein LOC131604877 n=1 Tax=Vicia villosa TaxID=3911 RepID=UPI00273B2E8F|nr:uncharacterized protein LOC131604877 [Vicia villosa]
MIFWLLCHRRLATKSRLCHLGFLQNTTCHLCDKEENDNHIFFACEEYRKIWCAILNWLQIDHSPRAWDEEFIWIMNMGKGKGWRARLFKLAVTETVYGVWIHRNRGAFGQPSDYTHIIHEILDKIVYRGWTCKNLKTHIACLMVC